MLIFVLGAPRCTIVNGVLREKVSYMVLNLCDIGNGCGEFVGNCSFRNEACSDFACCGCHVPFISFWSEVEFDWTVEVQLGAWKFEMRVIKRQKQSISTQ